MKLTISQEGCNPIIINSKGDIIRSQEDRKPKMSAIEKAYTTNNVIRTYGYYSGTTRLVDEEGNYIINAPNPARCYLQYGIWQSLMNSLRSIGNFDSGKEMLESRQLKAVVDKKILNVYKQHKFPTITQLEQDDNAKAKVGFFNSMTSFGQASGKKVKYNYKTSAMILKLVDQVPVSICKLTPLVGTFDIKQLSGKRVLVATAGYVYVKGKIKSIPLCMGYLKSKAKGDVNPTRECADIYLTEDGIILNKSEIINVVKSIRSGECCPIDYDTAMQIVDELTL